MQQHSLGGVRGEPPPLDSRRCTCNRGRVDSWQVCCQLSASTSTALGLTTTVRHFLLTSLHALPWPQYSGIQLRQVGVGMTRTMASRSSEETESRKRKAGRREHHAVAACTHQDGSPVAVLPSWMCAWRGCGFPRAARTRHKKMQTKCWLLDFSLLDLQAPSNIRGPVLDT